MSTSSSRFKKTQEKDREPLKNYKFYAVNSLKERLISRPVLSLPLQNGHYTLHTDTFHKRVGYVIPMDQGNGKTPLQNGRWSRNLNAQGRYLNSTHLEYLTVDWTMPVSRSHLKSPTLTLDTDHHAPRWILNLTDATGELVRWRLRVIDPDFQNVHRAGIKHQAADAFSCLPTNGSFRTLLEDDIPASAVTQANKQALNPLMIDKAEGSHPKIN